MYYIYFNAPHSKTHDGISPACKTGPFPSIEEAEKFAVDMAKSNLFKGGFWVSE